MRSIKAISHYSLVVLIAWACTHDPIEPKQNHRNEIRLKWFKSHQHATQAEADTGMMWLCSYLGAAVQKESYARAAKWEEHVLILDLDEIGFDQKARTNLLTLYQASSLSEQHQLHGAMDMGRFAAATLCNAAHYYAITGVPTDLSAFLAGHGLSDGDSSFAVMQSTVSTGPRLIRTSDPEIGNARWYAVAVEGTFDSASGTMDTAEIEAFDFMKNGQPRFAIYRPDGALKLGADSAYSSGGKPAKCMWCHESNFNPNFAGSASHAGFLSVDSFNQNMLRHRQEVTNWQQQLPVDVQFIQKQNHSYAEWLYLDFYEPSAMRLAAEWGTDAESVKLKLQALSTHDNPEFEFLKDRYHRREVLELAPVRGLEVPDKPRELSTFEPEQL